MTLRLLTEAGEQLVAETVAGFANASSLNDSLVSVITKETFTTDPIANGWLIGSGWSWNAGNGNIEAV